MKVMSKISIYLFALIFTLPDQPYANNNIVCTQIPSSFKLRDQNREMIFLKAQIDKSPNDILAISIFQTTCSPCIEEIKYLNQLKSSRQDLKLDLMLLNSKEQRSLMISFLQDHSFIALKSLSDPYGLADNIFEIRLIPKLVFVNKKGIILKAIEGSELSKLIHNNKIPDIISELMRAPLCKQINTTD